jgi:hypothetical protein
VLAWGRALTEPPDAAPPEPPAALYHPRPHPNPHPKQPPRSNSARPRLPNRLLSPHPSHPTAWKVRSTWLRLPRAAAASISIF